MAELVLTVASSHGPQLNIPPDKWYILKEKDEKDEFINYKALLAKARPGLEQEITDARWRERYEASHKALDVLRAKINEANLDALIVVADDQHEQFMEENMPMFNIYYGETLPLEKRFVGADVEEWRRVDDESMPDEKREYPGAPALALHLIESLRKADFDVAASRTLRANTVLGHAFTFLYRWVMPDCTVPTVTVSLNSFFPPNQPTPKRCYAFGQSLRRAVESWEGGQRVGILASGGLSHVVINEDIDRTFIDALQRKDVQCLTSLPEASLRGGTSELRNWISVAAAAEDKDMTLVDYVPCYRSLGGTGCAMGFAYWQ